MPKKKISVVIPCYYSEQSITAVVEETIKYLYNLERFNYEFILVNDGSLDMTFQKIKALADLHPFILGIDLAKNCGQHNAILAGMQYANGDYILGMDDDFQTHPSQISKLIDKLEEGYDIVYGKYPQRRHNAFRNFGSTINDLTIRFLLDKPKGLKACPMYLIKNFVRDEIIKSQSAFTNLQGLFLRSSSKIANAEIEHYNRKFGASGYTLKKLLRLWSSFLNYSAKPIRMLLSLGGGAFLFGIIYLLLALVLSFSDYHKIFSGMMTFSGLIIFSLGLVGEYVVRMFLAITAEPQYVIRNVTGKDWN